MHLILLIDSRHPSHKRLCQNVDRLLPNPASTIEPKIRPLPRFYCSIWYNLDEEELKPFFFRLLDGDLQACRRYILELDHEGVQAAVDRCLQSVAETQQTRRELAESMWVELLKRQRKEYENNAD
jgi:hypothetical protein